MPLFALHSKKSIGVGEIPDLQLMIDWCKQTGLTLLQLLPLNEIGYDFRPYDAQSVIALDPMYLSLEELRGVSLKPFQLKIRELRLNHPCRKSYFDDRIKKAKLFLLGEIYESVHERLPAAFYQFVRKNKFWLEDYVLFKVIQERFAQQSWESWPEVFRKRDAKILSLLAKQHAHDLEFYRWLQWQLFEQLSFVKKYAGKRGVLIVGDMPFLAARNSDYVWAHQDYFKLDLLAGSPPDLDFAKGQRWGMPPYHWEKMADRRYDYLNAKLKYAENFYHLYRVDHLAGVFRVWTIFHKQPSQDEGLFGFFDPEDETKWEAQGRKLLRQMLKSTSMLPCAEDLGSVPDCARRVMEELGIPGMEVQRWARDWETSYEFRSPESYRPLSVSWISTHDTSVLRTWWKDEAGTVNAKTFEHWCRVYGVNLAALRGSLFDLRASAPGRLRWKEALKDRSCFLRMVSKAASKIPKLVLLYESTIHEREQFLRLLGTNKISPKLLEQALLEKSLESNSIFSIQLLQDWLSVDPKFQVVDDPAYRINVPGTLHLKNWHLRISFSLEQMKTLKVNRTIRKLVESTDRI